MAVQLAAKGNERALPSLFLLPLTSFDARRLLSCPARSNSIMRFSIVALVALVAPAVFAASIPSANQVQDALSSASDQVKDQLRFNFDDGDSCGSFKVRCVRKDQKKVVGDVSLRRVSFSAAKIMS